MNIKSTLLLTGLLLLTSFCWGQSFTEFIWKHNQVEIKAPYTFTIVNETKDRYEIKHPEDELTMIILKGGKGDLSQEELELETEKLLKSNADCNEPIKREDQIIKNESEFKGRTFSCNTSDQFVSVTFLIMEGTRQHWKIIRIATKEYYNKYLISFGRLLRDFDVH